MYLFHRDWHARNSDPIPPAAPNRRWGADQVFGTNFLQMHHEVVKPRFALAVPGVNKTGAEMKTACGTCRKPFEWRRRESNPRPGAPTCRLLRA